MKSAAVAGVIDVPARALASPLATTRLAFMDNLRYLMVVLVVVYHSVAAYAVLASYWAVRDTGTYVVDIGRQLLDVFMMPVLFFVAGYFGLRSLQKKGAVEFIKDKVTRLLVPWTIAVLVILPLFLYDQPTQLVRPFRTFWLWYLGGFRTELRLAEASPDLTTQAVYWFISLLFAFFLVLTVGYAMVRRWRGPAIIPTGRKMSSDPSVGMALVIFGLVTFAAYFVSLLLVPDSSWFTLGMLLEFQVTRLVLNASYFAFGVYAFSRGWFADGKPLGNLGLWGIVSAVLGLAYLVVGRPMFADTSGTADFAVGYLMLFAFLRSFLLLSLMVVFATFGIRFWNRASGLDVQLAGASFNIYLVHLFPIIGLQEMMREWTGGPVEIKSVIVSMMALWVSFAISRWLLARHSRPVAFGILTLLAFCLVARP